MFGRFLIGKRKKGCALQDWSVQSYWGLAARLKRARGGESS
jgi:hypothetical protein